MASAEVSTWALGARSETGYVRTSNEDRMGWTRTPYGNVYVVADGMGGYRGGALAAELTVTTLKDRLAGLAPGDAAFTAQVQQAFLAANQAVYQHHGDDAAQTPDMGATGVALITWGPHILVGHVGDSRAYLWRTAGALKRLTRDHARLDLAGVLDRAIGHLPTVEAEVTSWITLNIGDMVLLCSDGLSGYVDDAEISAILASQGDQQALADRLVDCALAKGGEDNVTVQLVRLTEVASIRDGVVERLLRRLRGLIAVKRVASGSGR
jgi:serine/threonine protein phosphatase PrpC